MNTTPWLFVALLLSGCAHHPTLPPAAAERLAAASQGAGGPGEPIYQGEVYGRRPGGGPLFRYQRWVRGSDQALVSSHITTRLDGEPLVVQIAAHDPSYSLRTYDEIHGQTGLVGRLDVNDDQLATFDVTVGGRRAHRVESGRDPVQVGPTLFGFTLAHWDELMAGARVPLRFAVLADQRTYGFVLTLDERRDGTTVIGMRATNLFVRLAVPKMSMVFDDQTRAIVRYEGPVPPRTGPPGRERALDARVEYEMEGTFR